jgi:hypothetical protein
VPRASDLGPLVLGLWIHLGGVLFGLSQIGNPFYALQF